MDSTRRGVFTTLVIASLALAGSADLESAAREQPKSPLVPDAMLQLAEDHFQRGEMADARRGYDRIVQAAPDSSTGRFARYKRAWCHYNLGDIEAALSDFEALSGPGRDGEALSREARKDWLRTWSMLHGCDRAKDALTRLFGGAWPDAMRRLAAQYEDDGKDRDAVKCWQAAAEVATRPLDKLDLQAGVTRALLRMGQRKATLEAVHLLLERWDQVRTASGLSSEDRQQAYDRTEGFVRELAVAWYAESFKTPSDQALRDAMDLLWAYLRHFSGNIYSHDLRLSYAQGLVRQDRFDEAARQFDRLALEHADPQGRAEARTQAAEARSKRRR